MSFALGTAGRRLIQSFEQCRLTAYQDQGGVWTIGWGHTGADVVEGLTCTQTEADAWFDQDISHVLFAVNAGLTPQGATHISQNKFDALVTFAFNVGVAAEAHSTLLRYVNALNYGQAADEFRKWNHVNGQVSDGLTRRREAERTLFLTP